MKKLINGSRLVVVMVALLFGLFSIDSLFEDIALGDKVLNFMILITPGLMILLVLIFFRHYYKLSGLMFLGMGVIYFFFFRPYIDFSQGWPVLLAIVVPFIIVVFIHIFYKSKMTKVQ